MANNNKKQRLAFSNEEWAEIYSALGAKVGMIKDLAAINDMKPSEYTGKTSVLISMQDRIYNALHDENTAEDPPPPPLASTTPSGG